MEPSDRFGFIKLVTKALLLIVALSSALSAQARPALEIDRAGFDFGQVPDNCTLVHQTWLRSAGEDTLEITDIKTGCSCITVPLDKDRLAPGDSVLLTLHWRFRGADGPIERVPYLFSNDDTGPHRLLLQAEVAPADNEVSPLSCQPQRIEFGSVARKKDYRRVFTIRNSTDSDRAVNLVSQTDMEYHLELPDTVRAGDAATGIVILESDFADSEFERSFTLEFPGDDENNIRVTLAVSRGDFSFRPAFTTSIDTLDTNNIKR